jgi:hypothetical protein
MPKLCKAFIGQQMPFKINPTHPLEKHTVVPERHHWHARHERKAPHCEMQNQNNGMAGWERFILHA